MDALKCREQWESARGDERAAERVAGAGVGQREPPGAARDMLLPEEASRRAQRSSTAGSSRPAPRVHH
jgi:hypothetical protein